MPEYVQPEERDFFSYLDQLKYEETLKNTDSYLRNVKVVNFELIHHKCRGDPLEKDTKEYFSIENKDFAEYPKNDQKRVIGGALRNQNSVKQPIFIQKEAVLNYFLDK